MRNLVEWATCPRCDEAHVQLVAGQRYRIDAEDCCLNIYGLIGTFVSWEPSGDGTVPCDVMRFAEGFTLGPSWSRSEAEFTPLPEPDVAGTP